MYKIKKLQKVGKNKNIKEFGDIKTGYFEGTETGLLEVVRQNDLWFGFMTNPNSEVKEKMAETIDCLMVGDKEKALYKQKEIYEDPILNYRGYPKAPNNLYKTGKMIRNLKSKISYKKK